MKGIVFTLMEELVESQYGLETWDRVIAESNLPSGGIYTAGGTYPESELVSILQTLAKITKTPPQSLLKTYGEFMFSGLVKRYGDMVPSNISLKDFLKTIDAVIHVEVKKLYPVAELPTFRYEDPAPNELVMLYQSPRKLCALAMGLIEGAAKHYHEKVDIKETRCMHKGDNHCRLELKFSKGKIH